MGRRETNRRRRSANIGLQLFNRIKCSLSLGRSVVPIDPAHLFTERRSGEPKCSDDPKKLSGIFHEPIENCMLVTTPSGIPHWLVGKKTSRGRIQMNRYKIK